MNIRNPLLLPSLFISLQFSALCYRHNIYPWLQKYQRQILSSLLVWASLRAQLVKNPPAMRKPGFDPWVGKIPWRRERLPTPVFWPGEFHGLYSPWGRKESDMTERLSHLLIFCGRLEYSQTVQQMYIMSVVAKVTLSVSVSILFYDIYGVPQPRHFRGLSHKVCATSQ